MVLSEGRLHGVLDGQTGHGSCGEVLHVLHSLLHLRSAAVRVEGELWLNHAAVLQQADAGGIVANVKELQQVNDEGLDLLVIVGADASRAVNDKDEIQRDGFAGILCNQKEVCYAFKD